jgi:C1A family cysteine protease
MYRLAATVGFLTAAAAQSTDYKALWAKFKRDYDKPGLLGSSKEDERFGVFKRNVDIINTENAKGHSYQLGINQFADLTSEEFAQTYARGVKPSQIWGDVPQVPFPNMSGQILADSVDWVAEGAVTPVKNQAKCGSCWAFSTTGSVEGAYQIASGKLVSLSEENLVECDHVDNGCHGGAMQNAFEWIKKNGICTETDYPYSSGQGQTGDCKSGCKPAVTVTGYTNVPPNSEEALKAAVSKQPVSIAIEADQSAFQLYHGGVLDNPACGTKLDHGVLIVGYGTDGGKDYWKVKNSWGPAWGEKGYIRLVRGENMCGVAAQPSYPVGAKDAGHSPSPGPSPPVPPPAPGSSHYEDPTDGCQSDEKDIRIQGVNGDFCSPACVGTRCPADVPPGVTAQPQCALRDQSGDKYCALICSPGANDGQCGTATCKAIQGVGICTYDDSMTPLTTVLNPDFFSVKEIVV